MLLQAKGANDCAIEQAVAHQLSPMLSAAKAGWHKLHAGHAMQEALVQQVCTEPDQPSHQPVLPVGQPQITQAGVLAVAAYGCSPARQQLELLLHQLQAAAHRRLLYRQGRSCFCLGASQLKEIENVQVLQGCGRGVGVLSSPRRGAGAAAAGVGQGRQTVLLNAASTLQGLAMPFFVRKS